MLPLQIFSGACRTQDPASDTIWCGKLDGTEQTCPEQAARLAFAFLCSAFLYRFTESRSLTGCFGVSRAQPAALLSLPTFTDVQM